MATFTGSSGKVFSQNQYDVLYGSANADQKKILDSKYGAGAASAPAVPAATPAPNTMTPKTFNVNVAGAVDPTGKAKSGSAGTPEGAFNPYTQGFETVNANVGVNQGAYTPEAKAALAKKYGYDMNEVSINDFFRADDGTLGFKKPQKAAAPASTSRKPTGVQTGSKTVTNADGSTSTVPVFTPDKTETDTASRLAAGVTPGAPDVNADPVIKQLQAEQARLAKQREALQAKLDAGTASGLDQSTQDAVMKQYKQVEDDIKARKALADSVRDTNKNEASRQYDLAIENQRRVSAQQDINAQKLAAITGASWTAEGTRGLDEVHAEGQKALNDLNLQKANYLSNWQAQADEASLNFVSAIRENTQNYNKAVADKYSNLVTSIAAIDEKSGAVTKDILKEKKDLVKEYLDSVHQSAVDAREDAKFNLDVFKYNAEAIRNAHNDQLNQFDKGVADLGAGLSSASAADILKGSGMENDPMAIARIQAAQSKAVMAAVKEYGYDTPETAQMVQQGMAAGLSPTAIMAGVLKANGFKPAGGGDQDVAQTAQTYVPTEPRECTAFASDVLEKAGYGRALSTGLTKAEDDTLAFKQSKVNSDEPAIGSAVLLDMGTKYGHWGIITGQDANGNLLMTSSNLQGPGADGKPSGVSTVALPPNDPRIQGYFDPTNHKTNVEQNKSQVLDLANEYAQKGTTAVRKKEIETELRRMGTNYTDARKLAADTMKEDNKSEIAARFGSAQDDTRIDFTKLDQRAQDQLAELGPDGATAALQLATYNMDPKSMGGKFDDKVKIKAAANVISQQLFGKPYDETSYLQKSGAVQAWKSAQPNVTAYNTVLQHLGEMKGFLEDYKGAKVIKWNDFENALRTQFGDSTPTELKTILETVASETAKVYKGNASPTDSDKEEVRNLLNSNMSPEQFEGFIKTAQHLIGGRIAAMAEGYKQSVGRFPPNALTPETVNSIRYLNDPKTMAMVREIAGDDQFTPEENSYITTNSPIVIRYAGKTERLSPIQIGNDFSANYLKAETMQEREKVKTELVGFLKDNLKAFADAGVNPLIYARNLHMDERDLAEQLKK